MITDPMRIECRKESKTYQLMRHPDRVKQLGEVFTPTELVLEILDQLPPTVWLPGKTVLDPTVGNGQFLAAVLLIKQGLGHSNSLSTIYGVDIMQDNVDECRQRLIDIAGDTPANWAIVKHNIRCEDGLTYDYSFAPLDDPLELYKKSLGPRARKAAPTVAQPIQTTMDTLFGTT
jgi:hypothetical protein